jgi:hypothetical protein
MASHPQTDGGQTRKLKLQDCAADPKKVATTNCICVERAAVARVEGNPILGLVNTMYSGVLTVNSKKMLLLLQQLLFYSNATATNYHCFKKGVESQ